MQKDKSYLTHLIEFFPAFTGIVFVLTSVKLICYYSFFGLNVFNYIELSEYVFKGLNSIISLSVYLIYGLFIDTSKKFVFNPESNENSSGIIFRQKAIRLILGFLVLLFISSLINYFLNGYSTALLLRTLVGLLAICAMWVGQQISKYYINNYQGNYKPAIPYCITILFMFIAFIGYQSSLDAIDTKYNQLTIKDSIVINNKIINSNKYFYYIGETENYVFFHDELLKSNSIYPKKAISQINLSFQ